ncbi:hypothetical protein MKC68_10695 [[Clostridium] innocuum]|jgi:hypothetical protein|nr:hypothetical protein [[Clostridium] innocuum]QSI25277.1 hypothetical protein GKZ87_07165 [Erysipelotrichaceae bacterium 66202529]DAQ27866.1 MAG TPA: GCN4P-II CORE MUTANT, TRANSCRIPTION REGULATION.8A [Caudoviricetes sp.]
MKFNLDYRNNALCISVEMFDDGTKYEHEYDVKTDEDNHIDFSTDFMADLYGREDMYAKMVETAMTMEEEINNLTRRLSEMEAEEKHIRALIDKQR